MRSYSDELVLPGVDLAGQDGAGAGLSLGAAAEYASAAIGTALTGQAASTTDYPYDTVVRITAQVAGYTLQGSGVLISPDEVLTASHVLYQSDLGTVTNIDVAPGYTNGTAPFGHATGTIAHYSQIADYPYLSLFDTQSDYAIIHLSTPFTGLGSMGILPGFAGGAVHVTGFPGDAGGAMVDSAQSVTGVPRFTVLDGLSIGEGSSGGPVWQYGADGLPYVVGVVSSGSVAKDANGQSAGFFTQITPAVSKQIVAWVHQDDAGAAGPSVQAYDATLRQSVPDALSHFYTGPVAGIQEQYVTVSPDNLSITAGAPNYFIHTGSGNDAISVLSGTNALDGGAGSNFLAGGTGTDTFYVDDRGAGADIWSTVAHFHAGDSATVLGVSPGLSVLNWADGQGTPGFTGLTLHASTAGRPTASLTLAGFTQADMASGRLAVQYGYDAASASSYLYVHDNR